MQVLISRAALSQLPKASIRKNHLGKLTNEVTNTESGISSSMLVFDEDGEVCRLVSVAGLKIQRADMCIFAQVGSWSDGEMKANCKLPGAKVYNDELPAECLERVIREELPFFRDVLDIESTRHTSEKLMSKDFGVMTQYKRTIYNGYVPEGHSTGLPTCTSVISKVKSTGSGQSVTSRAGADSLAAQEVLVHWQARQTRHARL